MSKNVERRRRMIHQINEKKRVSRTIVAFVFSLISVTGILNSYSITAQSETVQSHQTSRSTSSAIHTTSLNRTSSSPYHVYLGGDAIGIKIMTEGLIVMDTFLVETADGAINPAKEAGVLKGDVIVAVNNKEVKTINDYKDQVRLYEKTGYMQVTINRKGHHENIVIKPVMSNEGVITTGMYLRDNMAGIGTLTFVDAKTYQYGALGHEITDQTTQQLVKVTKGEITKSNVLSIRRAQTGHPGEKVADIYEHEQVGTLVKNNYYGIYGHFEKSKLNRPLVEVALMDEVKVGAAQIYTVLEGNKVEVFDIAITEVNKQNKKEVKGIKYSVTDERLLKETGGIVQGMSGSPIVQDGKLIGAVTHVLVNDPTIGYGLFIEWMIDEANESVETISTQEAA